MPAPRRSARPDAPEHRPRPARHGALPRNRTSVDDLERFASCGVGRLWEPPKMRSHTQAFGLTTTRHGPRPRGPARSGAAAFPKELEDPPEPEHHQERSPIRCDAAARDRWSCRPELELVRADLPYR